MKSKVTLSNYCIMITLVITGVIIGLLVIACLNEEKPLFYSILAISALLLVPSLLYAPMSVAVDDNYITVRSLLKKHRLRLDEIDSIRIFQPTMGATRLCASGGYWGYWGIFREGDVGRYVAYYGRSSDCFFIKMNNGDKYVLGCNNPLNIVGFIKTKIGQ